MQTLTKKAYKVFDLRDIIWISNFVYSVQLEMFIFT